MVVKILIKRTLNYLIKKILRMGKYQAFINHEISEKSMDSWSNIYWKNFNLAKIMDTQTIKVVIQIALMATKAIGNH